MDQTGILIFIVVACFIFTVVSAYLIYNHVQDEREQVYRARIRREKDQTGPSEHLKHSPNTKRKLAGPVVVPPKMITDPDPVPAPDPTLDPIITNELPAELDPPPEPMEPADVDSAPLIAMAAPVAVAGGVAAVTLNKPSAPQKEEKAPKKDKASKKEKGRRGSKTPEDFEDYRNFSPKALPPPKPAPPAAKYEPPLNPVYMEQVPTESFPMKSMERLERSYLDREGLRF